MHALSKINKHHLTHPGMPKPVTVKTVILDTNDGAFTDSSVKVRPHKTDASKVVLKCVDAARLAKAVIRMGLKACDPLIKGSKHFIVVCWKAEVGAKLFGGAPQVPHTINSGKSAAFFPKKAPMLIAKGGK